MFVFQFIPQRCILHYVPCWQSPVSKVRDAERVCHVVASTNGHRVGRYKPPTVGPGSHKPLGYRDTRYPCPLLQYMAVSAIWGRNTTSITTLLSGQTFHSFSPHYSLLSYLSFRTLYFHIDNTAFISAIHCRINLRLFSLIVMQLFSGKANSWQITTRFSGLNRG